TTSSWSARSSPPASSSSRCSSARAAARRSQGPTESGDAGEQRMVEQQTAAGHGGVTQLPSGLATPVAGDEGVTPVGVAQPVVGDQARKQYERAHARHSRMRTSCLIGAWLRGGRLALAYGPAGVRNGA